MSTPQLSSSLASGPLPPVESGIYNVTPAFGGSVELDARGWDAIVHAAFVHQAQIGAAWLLLAFLAFVGAAVTAFLLWKVHTLQREIRALTRPAGVSTSGMSAPS